jgi:L,D-peptidoglycan transpeptidase YkuD (ErfK/YbiS/YcfS/YnhG family)
MISNFALNKIARGDEKFLLTREQHQQLILVITDNWQVDHGLLYTFEKKRGQWQPLSKAAPITVGKNGLAWGLGVHNKQQGKYKIEGDGKAPAGIFVLGKSFGYLQSVNTQLVYQRMTAEDYCIDINDSPYYNQLVNKAIVGEQAIKGSSEPMRRDIHFNGDHRYKKGIVIKHNPSNISAQGSCIFMHIWKRSGVATSGCTAMSENVISNLLAWLEPKKNPLYIALPKAQYLAKKERWALPDITTSH